MAMDEKDEEPAPASRKGLVELRADGPPGVPARVDDLYDRAYYLGDCEGFQEFLRSRGRTPSRRLRKCLALVGRVDGKRVIDLGCGRGEIALHLAAAGARVAAVDPSRDALAILGEAIGAWRERSHAVGRGIPARPDASVPLRVRAVGQRLPFAEAWADAIVLSDVVEHVFLRDLRKVLQECLRVLRPGGRLLIHTQPNRTLLRVTVPVIRTVSRLWGVSLPADLRSELTSGSGPAYHPAEQTRRSLDRALRGAGFSIEEIWLEGSWAVHRIFGNGPLKAAVLPLFRRSRTLKALLATQIFAVARAPLRARRGPEEAPKIRRGEGDACPASRS